MNLTDERAHHVTGTVSELAKLLDAGYEVQFTQNPEGDDYLADVVHHALGYDCTGIGDTPAEAIWAASPLASGADEPCGCAGAKLTAAALLSIRSEGYAQGYAAGAAAAMPLGMCVCGHTSDDHTTPGPNVKNLRGTMMCDRDDCDCLTYRPRMETGQ